MVEEAGENPEAGDRAESKRGESFKKGVVTASDATGSSRRVKTDDGSPSPLCLALRE